MFQVPGQQPTPLKPPSPLAAGEHKRLLSELRTCGTVCSVCLVFIVLHLIAFDVLMLSTLIKFVQAIGGKS